MGIRSYDERVVLSPDRQKILYQKNYAGGQLWLVSSDGQNNKSLSINKTFTSNWNAVWLGDSKRILFTGYKESESGLYLFNIESQNLQKVSFYTPGWKRYDISSDGSTLAYLADSTDQFGMTINVLYQKDITTGDSLRLNIASRPIVISPNGKYIIYAADAKLWSINTENRQRTVLEKNGYNDESVRFSPDGASLISHLSKTFKK